MSCWSTQEPWSGQVQGFLLDRRGTEKQRRPGIPPKARHETGKMRGPALGTRREKQAWASPSAQVGSAGLQRGAQAGQRQGQGPRKCLANSPGKGDSPNVSIFG